MTAWQPVPLELTTDHALGGRWTSLAGGGREWLWTNPDPAIAAARPRVAAGDAFVDAGGGEECFPCVREPFDHGLVWHRPWQRAGDAWGVEVDGYVLDRRITHDAGVVQVDYAATARSPRRVLHATHLLLDLSPDAELHPAGHGPVRFWDARPDAEIDALGGEDAFVRALGRGSTGAVCYTLLDCTQVTVVDGDDALRLMLEAPPDVPLSMVVWRNLRGWPENAPYRSIGVEPALGRDLSLPPQRPEDAVRVGPGLTVTWRLTVAALRR